MTAGNMDTGCPGDHPLCDETTSPNTCEVCINDDSDDATGTDSGCTNPACAVCINDMTAGNMDT
eukprot:gene2621-12262_t